MSAKVLMIQGTGSHVGKSLLTAALCRIFKQDGFRVLPFKAQNMSNNAYVTKDGGEIGRAQAEQAFACGIEPSVLVNPILLKPTTDVGAQVIVLGKAVGTMTAQEYQEFKPQLLSTVTQTLHGLMEQADILVIEGAGSPAEINLKASDLVNMWVAKQAQANVLLVGDIDRGGIFAQLVGTMELLDEEERRLVRGFVINKFRGDRMLLESGVQWLEARYGLPVVGVVPYFQDVELLEEDSIPEHKCGAQASDNAIHIEVIHLPRISNFTDFSPLEREPDVQLRYIDRPSTESLPDCLILPGSKSTIADLAFIRERGFDDYLQRCAAAGREIVGICGGFQMLGRQILDPDHAEATVSTVEGLGFLPATTVFDKQKVVSQVRGVHLASGLSVAGYEIHMGRMQKMSSADPVFRLRKESGTTPEHDDGLQAPNGRIWGTHIHGLFDTDGFRRWWLNRVRQHNGLLPLAMRTVSGTDGVYDRLAEAVRPHINLQAIYDMLRSK